MSSLHGFFASVGIFGGLLLGAPLFIIGLAMRGLARRRGARMSVAASSRRRIADVIAAGPVALVGRVRRLSDGRVLVEDPSTRADVIAEVDDPSELADGQSVLVFGDANREEDVERGYRDNARTWVVDARGDDYFAEPYRIEPSAQLLPLRLQAIAGAIIFAAGLTLAAVSMTAALSDYVFAGFAALPHEPLIRTEVA